MAEDKITNQDVYGSENPFFSKSQATAMATAVHGNLTSSSDDAVVATDDDSKDNESSGNGMGQPTETQDIPQPIATDEDVIEHGSNDNEQQPMQNEMTQDDNDETREPQPEHQQPDQQQPIQIEQMQDHGMNDQPQQEVNQEEKQEQTPMNAASTVSECNDVGSLPIIKQQTEIQPDEDTEAINNDNQELALGATSNRMDIEDEKEDTDQPTDATLTNNAAWSFGDNPDVDYVTSFSGKGKPKSGIVMVDGKYLGNIYGFEDDGQIGKIVYIKQNKTVTENISVASLRCTVPRDQL